jgi:hypothetical protein
MQIEKLLDAVNVIEEVCDFFGKLPEEQQECVTAALHCRLVSLYLIQLAKHLQNGMDTYDACLATAQGKMTLEEMGASDSQITLLKLATPTPKK